MNSNSVDDYCDPNSDISVNKNDDSDDDSVSSYGRVYVQMI